MPRLSDFPDTDRFGCVRRLGSGGMGVVFEAIDHQRNGLRVALKTLKYHERADHLHRFREEFSALAQLRHRYLVPMFDIVGDGDQWFFTMELVDGVNLNKYFRPGKSDPNPLSATASDEAVPDTQLSSAAQSAVPRTVNWKPDWTLDYDAVRRVFHQLAEALCFIHGERRLHRDVKPSNVMVRRSGDIVLLDFGVSAPLHTLATGIEDSIDATTGNGIVGTLDYMAPEQLRADRVTEASDFYTFGATLYEVLTGHVPFAFHGDLLQLIEDKLGKPPAPVSRHTPDVPADLATLCLELLRSNPASRPTGGEILDRLQSRSPAVAATPTAPSEPESSLLFLGREPQLAELHRALADMIDQQQAVIVHVLGNSGDGKSTLVQNFLVQVMRRHGDAVVLTGRCFEQASVSYKAVDSLVDSLATFLRKLSRRDPGAADAVLPRPQDTAALARVFRVLKRVPAIEAAARHELHIPDQQELRRRAFGALRTLLTRLADRRPLVLFIDDLQWGDVDSARLLDDLLRPPDPPPLLLILSYRSEDRTSSPCLREILEPSRKALPPLPYREIPVGPLGVEQARDLALLLLGEADDDAAARAVRIADESAGKPFFIYELAKYARQSVTDGISPGSGGVPTLDAVLWSRIEGLPTGERRLLEVVAVAGRPLRQLDAFRASDLDEDVANALVTLDSLSAQHLLRSRGRTLTDELETYHDQIRCCLVDHLAPRIKCICYLRLAMALECDETPDFHTLADYYRQADQLDRAGIYYALAAKKASDALAFARAAELYRSALQYHRGDEATRRQLQVTLGDALANAGRGHEAAATYEAVADVAPATERVDLHSQAAFQYIISGYFSKGLLLFRSVLSHMGLSFPHAGRHALRQLLRERVKLRLRGLGFRTRDPDAIPRQVLSRIDLCWFAAVGFNMIDFGRSAYFHTVGLLAALSAGEPSRIARALVFEAYYRAVMRKRTIALDARLTRRAAALVEGGSSERVNGLIDLVSGLINYMQAKWAEARSLFERAESSLQVCPGATWELMNARLWMMYCDWWLGDLQRTARSHAAIVKEASERDDLYTTLFSGVGISVFLHLSADSPRDAQHQLNEFRTRWPQTEFQSQHFFCMISQAHVDLYERRNTGCWDALMQAWQRLGESVLLRAQTFRIIGYYHRALCALSASRECGHRRRLLDVAVTDARRLGREGVGWATAFSRVIECGVAASRGDADGARDVIGLAAEAFEAANMRLYAAAARRSYGRLLGGQAGEGVVAEVDGWMIEQGIRMPERMSQALVGRVDPPG